VSNGPIWLLAIAIVLVSLLAYVAYLEEVFQTGGGFSKMRVVALVVRVVALVVVATPWAVTIVLTVMFLAK
jgi:hypothetical protein